MRHTKGNVGVDGESCDLDADQATSRVITRDTCEKKCRQSCEVHPQCKMAVFDVKNRTCVHTTVIAPLKVADAHHAVESSDDFVTFVKSTCSQKCKSDELDSSLVVEGKCTRWLNAKGDCVDEMDATSTEPSVDCRACAMGDDGVHVSEGDVSCDAVEPPLNGSAGDCPDTLGHGRACAPQCDAGYIRRGLTKCIGGTLHPATCVPSHCEMTPPANGDVGECPETLEHGESCVPSCHPGYETHGQTTCHAGTLHLSTCEPMSCDSLTFPRGATRGNCADTLQHGQSCEPACPAGQRLSRPLACELGQLTPATCEARHCTVVAPMHGSIGDCPSTLEHGKSCKVACSDGFASPTTTVTCNYGKLDGVSCEPLGCDIAQHVINQPFDPKLITDTLIRSGTTLEPTCSPGYKTSGVFQCENGQLTRQARCIPTSCAVRLPSHASMGQCGATLEHGETCELACAPGYQLKGTTTCTAGKLTTSTCEPMICPNVNIPSNAASRGDCPTSMEHGASCSPVCEAGTTLTSKTKCDQGVLKLAVCTPDSCDMRLPSGHAGMGDCNGTLAHGESCTPACLSGHALSRETTCEKGHLSVGKCEPMACDITPSKLPKLARLGKCPSTLRHGETCMPECAPGYTMVAPLECSLGNLTVGACVPSGCDVLNVPEHGMTGTCRSELKHDESCRMTCDDGYDISGDTTCTFGVASNAQCVPNSCTVTGIANGSIGDCPTTLSHGRACRPACKHGYELDQPLSCRLGKLSDSACVARACVNVTPPNNASSNGDCGDELKDGESCTPVCNAGYTLRGKTECARGVVTKAECVPDDCHGLKAPTHGSLGDCTDTLAHGRVCTPVCDAGYTASPGPILCNAGALSGTPACIPKSCHVSAPPMHGTMGTCKSELKHEETCRPRCELGYTLTREMSCNAGLLTTAVCTEDGCAVSAPQNGSMGDCPETLEHGESCVPSCNPGYSLTNETSCHLGVSKPSLCVPDACRVSAPSHGDLGACSPTIEHGSTCEPNCDDGYELVGAMSCVAGSLTQVARCEPKSCTMTAPTNGRMGNCPSLIPDGHSCEPECDRGFVRNIATSCSKGVIEKSSCLPASCDVSPPEHGNMGECASVLLHGESCQPGCTDGYTLEGQVVCAHGTLAQTARCVPNECIIDGDSDCEPIRAIPHGESYTPTCSVGFTLSGGPLVCNAGTLHGEYECLPASCDVSPPENGTLGTCIPNLSCDKGTSKLAHGEYCSFQCNAGYVLDGDPTIRCEYGQINGKSTCKLKSCDLLGVDVDDAEMSGFPERLEHGESFTPTCRVGFTLVGGPLTCNAGKLDGAVRCRPDACEVQPPANGALGSCQATIQHGESCMPVCNDGFSVAGGHWTCNAGQLSGSFACVPKADATPLPLTLCRIYSTCATKYFETDVFSQENLTKVECDAKEAELSRQNPTFRFTSTWIDFAQAL